MLWAHEAFIDRLLELKYSIDNIAWGMGGGLLQKVNRDTCKFALKCCAAYIDGEWVDVFKDPSTYDEEWNRLDVASFKASKKGRLELLHNAKTGEYRTAAVEAVTDFDVDWELALEDVYADGFMLRRTPFSEVRRNAGTFV